MLNVSGFRIPDFRLYLLPRSARHTPHSAFPKSLATNAKAALPDAA
jgi:hypothetical protein